MTHTADNKRFKLQFEPAEIPRLAKRYGPEQDDSALAAGRRIRTGEFTRKQLSEVFEWKTKGRGRSRLCSNSDDEVADALGFAVRAKTERAAIAVLLGLNGIQVPVASAILTAIDPARYTVIEYPSGGRRLAGVRWRADLNDVCMSVAKIGGIGQNGDHHRR